MESLYTLSGKNVLVVGGSSGMGLAIARKCAGLGAHIIIASRSEDHLKDAAQVIGSGTEYHVVDTTSEESIAKLFQAAGEIDHLAIPGSSVRTGPIRDLALEDALFSMRSKFWGPYLCAKHARMRAGGSITLFSGLLSRRPGSSNSQLGPINAAVEGLGRALAGELAPIRVNTVSPGLTSGTGSYTAQVDPSKQSMYDNFAQRLPAGRVATAEDIANATVMLMTTPSITGITLDVDGGGLLS